MLVRQESVTRRIPPSYPAEPRIAIGSIVACVDIIHSVQSDLMCDLVEASEDVSLLEQGRTRWIAAAWSIIDNYDMLRQLVGSLTNPKPDYLSDLVNKLKIVRSMRNAMDHLGGNLKNVAKNKSSTLPPIHGNLSYVIPKIDKEGKLVTLDLCGFALGALPRGSFIAMGRMPGDQVKIPIDNIEFHAFGHHISISDLHDQLSSFLNIFIPQTEMLIERWVLDVAINNGVSVDDVMAEAGAMVSCAVSRVNFSAGHSAAGK